MSVISLTLAKSQVGADYDDQDDNLQIYIDGAEGWLESATGLKFSAATETALVNGGQFALWPPRCPVNSVTSVTDTESGSAESTDDWHLRKNGIYRDSGARWDAGRVNRWSVVYNGGYATVPPKVKSLLLNLITRAWDARGDKTAVSAAGLNIEWELFMDTFMWQQVNDLCTARSRFG